ncbi:MAG: hypothetical protein KGH71_02750 [Candidatus Micrarchaeota archaeon]|nr:hypothetical protein [Candidatus Micrarchaeota archaeon]
MRKYNLQLYFVAFLLLFSISNVASAQYWYQYGVRAGQSASQNSGASVSIQTITPQESKSGSLGYWVGENLDNGAFLQMGYVVENQSGMYPSNCNLDGCSGYEHLTAGGTQWFYEYFPSGYNGGFLGRLGPDNSVGANGTFHNYAFYYSGGRWLFSLDGVVVGNVSLGSSSSGPSMPVAFGEVANTTGVISSVAPVIFSNLSVYKSGRFMPAQQGLSYIGYGVGSKTNLRNPYGVQELDNRINYFEMGLGLPQPSNNTVLWSLGYGLRINSAYANISGNTNYVAYSTVAISAPQIVQINATARMKFVGWQGVGLGSYTGASNSTTVTMNSNLTETAIWQKEYYLNVTSQYGTAFGAGWYSNSTIVKYGVESNISQTGAASREIFEGWSNGNMGINGTVIITGAATINATWSPQYLVSVKSDYGSVSGGGWYSGGSVARIGIAVQNISISNSTQIGFYQWSNGNMNKSFEVVVGAPIIVTAQFRQLYLTELAPQSREGSGLSNVTFYIGNRTVTNSAYLYGGVDYQISYAYYKSVKMTISSNFTISSAGTVPITLPVYNIDISSRDIFGMPVNSLVALEFSNGTSAQMYTGPSGMITLENVPYGFATGTVSYFGIIQSLSVRDGAGSSPVFVSLLDIGIFAGVAIVIIIAYFAARRRFGKPKFGVVQVESV